MGVSNLMGTISAVLTTPAVIFITVVVILYLNFVNYVVRYRKKAPKVKKKKSIATPPPPPAEENSSEEE